MTPFTREMAQENCSIFFIYFYFTTLKGRGSGRARQGMRATTAGTMAA